MFPSTQWTAIKRAGERDPAALEEFASAYRDPVLRFISQKGFPPEEAEDVCQDAFLRLFKGGVLARAQEDKGRFRGLLLTVVRRTIQDRWRRQRPREHSLGDYEPAERDPEFDRFWVLHLAERALSRLREDGSPYYAVICGQVAGDKQDKQRLWLARKKLIAQIRHEVAVTCETHEEFEAEVAYLSRFLISSKLP